MKSAIIAAVIATVISATAATAATTLITGAQIKNGSIGAVDLSAGAKRALKGQHGPVGPQGATGARGPTGAQGATGVAGPAGGLDPAKTHYVQGDTVQIDRYGRAHAYCPAGEKAVSGGLFTASYGQVHENYPSDSGDSWTVSVVHPYPQTGGYLTAYAVCVSP